MARVQHPASSSPRDFRWFQEFSFVFPLVALVNSCCSRSSFARGIITRNFHVRPISFILSHRNKYDEIFGQVTRYFLYMESRKPTFFSFLFPKCTFSRILSVNIGLEVTTIRTRSSFQYPSSCAYRRELTRTWQSSMYQKENSRCKDNHYRNTRILDRKRK